MKTIQIRVHGRVQGVGFRYYTQRHAGDYSIKGWVRNSDDGCVEILAQGNGDNIANFLQIVEKGPVYARVDHLDVSDIEATHAFKDFRVSF